MGAFGTAVLTLKRLEQVGDPDDLGEIPVVPVETQAPYCRHRPLSAKELVEMGYTVGDMRWKSTIPTHLYSQPIIDALLALLPDDVIEVNGQEYQIDGGVKPFDDLEGRPFKATIISKKQIG